MDEMLAGALAKRLAAYSATAGVALAVAPEAGAQVIYHEFDPDVVVIANPPMEPYVLDFDDDGVGDLRFFACVRYGGTCIEPYPRALEAARAGFDTFQMGFMPAEGGNVQNGVYGYDPPYFPNPIVGAASRLDSGAVVGPAGAGHGFYRSALAVSAASYYVVYPRYPFYDAEGYAGFRFIAGDGALHYGWIRIAGDEWPGRGTAYAYAYEATPDTPITAGERSAALLDGAVDQTTFPASGGTLVYTFTVHNPTSDPLPLDLWLDADRDGAGTLSRRLGSGTLPAGATVTRTVRVRVPSGAAPGTYDVRFKLGDFATRRFITFERYAVTKQGSAVAEGNEAFAVAPVAGNLFGEAGEAVSVLPGMFAIGAPSPNPTTGRAEVTLSVAEAQGVTVTVHDALGRRVAVLHDGVLAAGAAHRLVFDGSALPAGVYVVRAVGEAFTDTRVVSLTR